MSQHGSPGAAQEVDLLIKVVVLHIEEITETAGIRIVIRTALLPYHSTENQAGTGVRNVTAHYHLLNVENQNTSHIKKGIAAAQGKDIRRSTSDDVCNELICYRRNSPNSQSDLKLTDTG